MSDLVKRGLSDFEGADEVGPEGLPPVLLGRATPEVRQQVEGFYRGVARMLEVWIQRSSNVNTQRSYRRAVMDFVRFLGLRWPTPEIPEPDESHQLLSATVADVRAWREELINDGKAPATLNHRLSALSGFYKFLREAAASELKLPILVPNPAHAQFITRKGTDPVRPGKPLSLALARKLLNLPSGDSVLEVRDRAILRTFLYAGVRIRTACLLDVADFHDDPDNPTLHIQEKGREGSKREIGIHFVLAEALREYVKEADLVSGALFRARVHPKKIKLGNKRISTRTMARTLMGYFEQLDGALVQVDGEDGDVQTVCRYSPHSLRHTTATLLDEAGVPMKRIQALLGHKDIRVTQNYIKTANNTRKSASHELQL